MPEINTRLEVNINLEVEFWCERCGSGICNNVNNKKEETRFTVEPCKSCLEDSYNEGYEKAKEKYENSGD